MNHTGKELLLMLQGKKPLSMFYDDAEDESEITTIPEKDFDPYVEKSEFAKGVKVYELAFDPRLGKHLKIKYVLYALTQETWRIPAMFLVLDVMMKMGKADEGVDRMTGTLLGYTESEIDEFIKKGQNSKR